MVANNKGVVHLFIYSFVVILFMLEAKKHIMRSYFMTRLVLLFMLMNVLSGNAFAQAPELGHGVVNIKGSIIEAPCTIGGVDQEQTIEFSTMTTGELLENGRGQMRNFNIHLLNCTLASLQPWEHDWSQFEVTFDGEHDDSLFGITGASGIGFEIRDREGNVARPGVPLPRARLQPGNQILNYTLQLIGDHHQLTAGHYHTAVRFKVDYF
ncbi:type 1 fimbrial protein [Enterobacter sp. DRP3]|nr:type 1 fimbrial protein [Enterobacter sp. DRP3]